MRSRALSIVALLGLIVITVWAVRQTHRSSPIRVLRHRPAGVMGTSCSLVAVSDGAELAGAERALAAAESELRRLEAMLSTWISSSPMSNLNAAGAERPIPVPPELAEVLQLSRGLYQRTDRTFDITAGPLIELWREAANNGRAPGAARIGAAREASTWHHLELGEDWVRKTVDGVRMDIDGIAKGYAIDRALERLESGPLRGGMVEVGGDLRVFGDGPNGGPWQVGIRSPFSDRAWAEIEIDQGAVCSSGDYARYAEIEGRRYSHILDPRSGRPVDTTRAVTVVGTDAATTDAWATALSVLGADGLALLAGTELEAMIVTGTAESPRVVASPGFRALLIRAEFELQGSGTGAASR